MFTIAIFYSKEFVSQAVLVQIVKFQRVVTYLVYEYGSLLPSLFTAPYY